MEKFQLPWNLDIESGIYLGRLGYGCRKKQLQNLSSFTQQRCISHLYYMSSGVSLGFCLSLSLRAVGLCILHLEIYSRNHQDRKREDWNTEAAAKCFCPEVIHASFAHICLAKGRHLATHNLNVVEKCKLRCIYSRRMKIFNSSMTWTLMTTIEGHALDGGCKWNCSWGADNKSYRELST